MRLNPTKTQLDYEEYLKTPHWQKIRNQLLGGKPKCLLCKSRKNLHIHHLTYENRGNEQLEDLAVLCRLCHFQIHRGLIEPKAIQWILYKKPKIIRRRSLPEFERKLREQTQ